MKKITKNAIKCLKCGDIVESKHRHDFRMCSCGAVFIDGGHDYVRCGGRPGDFELLTEYAEEEPPAEEAASR